VLKTVRIGILGCGHIALTTHIPLLSRHRSVSIAAIADSDPARLDAAARLVPRAASYVDWRKCVANPDLDAVVIAPALRPSRRRRVCRTVGR
jgi:predicted dehydrogenase